MVAESVTVSYDPGSFSAPSRSRAKLCPVCNTELEDKRKKYHDECRPADEPNTTTLKPSGGKVRGKTPKKVSDATQKGMNSIVGKLLYLITLWIAWNQLRQLGVPDQRGDIADDLAFTDDEAEVIGRPLTRIFLRTEGGRKLAPVLVENEDAIDAIFAFWDWYKRTTTTLDEYRKNVIPQQSTPVERMPRSTRQRATNRMTPTHERSATNGHAGQVEANRTESEEFGEWANATYVPPSDVDIIAEFGN